MKEITIEDVLIKNDVIINSDSLKEKIFSAMTEYASLNRQGWTREVEFADWIDINLMMGNRLNRLKDGTKKWFYNHSPEKKQGKQNWISYTTEELFQIFKSMPLPNKPI